jgi:hypothetical protein
MPCVQRASLRLQCSRKINEDLFVSIDSNPDVSLDYLSVEQREAIVEPVCHIACQLGSLVFGTKHIAETTATITSALSDSPTPHAIEATRSHVDKGVTYAARVYASFSHRNNAQGELTATLGSRATLELTYDDGRTQAHVRVGEFLIRDLAQGFPDAVHDKVEDARETFSSIQGVLRVGRAFEALTHNIRGDQPRAH